MTIRRPLGGGGEAEGDEEEAIPLTAKRKRTPSGDETSPSERRFTWAAQTIHNINMQLNRVRLHAKLSEDEKVRRSSAFTSLIQKIEVGEVTENNYVALRF